MKSVLPVATVITATAKLAPENLRSRYSRRSTIGTAERVCRTPKATSATTATSAPPSTAGEVRAEPYRSPCVLQRLLSLVPVVPVWDAHFHRGMRLLLRGLTSPEARG